MYSCSQCGTQINPDGVCPSCGTAHQIPQPEQQAMVQQPPAQAGGGDKFMGFLEVNGDNANVVLGGAKVNIKFILAGLGGLMALMFLLPWYWVGASFMGVSVGATANGFKVAFGEGSTGADALQVLPFLIAIALGLGALFQDKLAFLKGKVFLMFTCGFGGGLLLKFIFLGAYSGKVNKEGGGMMSLAPSAGWILSLIFYLIAIALPLFCFLAEKKKK